jgi:hypothetical protein
MRNSCSLFFLLFFSLNELLINLIDLILMILSHQLLNNLDVVIILLRTKTAYVCNLARSSQSFSHFFFRSFSVLSLLCSLVFCLFTLCSFVLSLFFRSRCSFFFYCFVFFVCLSQNSRLNRKKIIKSSFNSNKD